MEGMMWLGQCRGSSHVHASRVLWAHLHTSCCRGFLIKTPYPSTPCPVVCSPLKVPQLQGMLPVPCTPPWQFWFSCAIVWAHHQLLWPSGWVCSAAEDTWLINCSNAATTTLPRLVSMADSTRNPTCITETKHLLPVLVNMKVMQTPRAKWDILVMLQ